MQEEEEEEKEVSTKTSLKFIKTLIIIIELLKQRIYVLLKLIMFMEDLFFVVVDAPSYIVVVTVVYCYFIV